MSYKTNLITNQSNCYAYCGETAVKCVNVQLSLGATVYS